MVAGTAVAMAALASDSGAARADCFSAGARPLVTTDEARVYERSDGRTFACSYRHGRHVGLDGSFEQPLAPYAVNAHYVASLRRYCEGAACFHNVVEQSLITGRERFAVQNGGDPANCGSDDDCGARTVGRLLMKRNGSIAWIGCFVSFDRCTHGPYVVMRRDRRGARVLDEGARIRVNSLRITRAGRRIVWEKRGVERSATLR
jgi:hypothetical protein